MYKRALNCFLLVMFTGAFLSAENSYCKAMCTYSCKNFYQKEGVSAQTDPAAIDLCVKSCMDKKCLDD